MNPKSKPTKPVGQKPKEVKERKNILKGEFMLDAHPFIAFAPIDILSILICFIAIFALGYERIRYFGSSEWPTLFASSSSVLITGVVGTIGILVLRGLVGLVLKQRNVIEVIPRSLITFSYKIQTFKFMLYAMASYFIITITAKIIQGLGIFQVATGDVYAVFLSSAVLEEVFYRGLLIMGIQLGLGLIVYGGWDGMLALYNEKRHLRMIDVIAIVASAIIFMVVHANYWGDPLLMIVTIAGGISQGIFYVKSNCLLVVIGSHIIVNFSASGSAAQQLQ
jgi:membrane protease YdiL (CAAX protease family)